MRVNGRSGPSNVRYGSGPAARVYLFKQRSIALGSHQWMQTIPKKRYALFLRCPCGCA